MRFVWTGAALVIAAGVTVAAPSLAARSLPGHPLLLAKPGLRVYGPSVDARTVCPRLLPPPADALAVVKRAVQLAMPAFERRLKLDGRNAIVHVARADGSRISFVAGGCGRRAWARSVVAYVTLPHVKFSASLSQHRFAVGRVRQGWVMWGYLH